MHTKLYLLALVAAVLLASPSRAAAPPSASGPPLVIPVGAYGGDRHNADPGAEADRRLFAAILVNNENTSPSLARNCPGVSSTSTCQPYKYVDFLKNFCNTRITLAAYQYATQQNEKAFLHVYPGARTKSSRLVWDATPNPTGPNCAPDNADAVLRMNPADRAFNTYLYKNFWTSADYRTGFPAPYGAFEDDGAMLGGIVVGGYGQVSTEYGSGTTPSGFANQVGNSPHREAVDWETALGTFINGACGNKCVSMALNGIATGSGNIGPCNVISNGHCHGHYHAGVIDDQVAIDNVCRAAPRGNLKYLLAERPIFAGRFGYQFMDSQTMTVEINTIANLYAQKTGGCAGTKVVDAEPSYGEGGVGDMQGGYRVRLATLAFRWLVANPATKIPDRVISFQFTIGGTPDEVAYFFEDTLVPYGPEHSVVPFAWNGRAETAGGGCPSTSGDRGGAVSLLATCVGSAGVYCQQYQRLYINGVNYGKTAACLNTGTAPANIARSWFTRDPITSYRYKLALMGGEMTSVPYRGVPSGSIRIAACTNASYCTGRNSLSSQTAPFKGDGSEQLCGPCGIVLLESNQRK
ncbi:MAG TPA: hypothetical protein VHX17_01460 [Candidatus Cybelea sp.]|nr:hypothetical protein [Candidatus Cybelea sp.]